MTEASLLLSGDWHGNILHARWTIDRAVALGTDRIFQLGDFGYWEHQPAGARYLKHLQRYAAKARVTVYFLDGNHDKTSLLLSKYDERDDDGFILVRPEIRYAPRGHRWTWSSVRFMALGGGYSVDKQWRLAREERPGTLWFPEEQMTDDDLDAILTDRTPVDVLLSHDKPRSSRPAQNRKDLPECYPNQERIQRAATALHPRLLVHGHLHYRYTDRIRLPGRWCTVEGLDADPNAALGVPADSLLLLDLTNLPEPVEASA